MFESSYAELHAHSAYSFLEGANEPEELVTAAQELGLTALALTDRDGMPGIVRHSQAGREAGLSTIHGSELTLEGGIHLPLLARNPQGYRRIVSAISQHNLVAGHKTDPAHRLDTLAEALFLGSTADVLVLTGAHGGPLRQALGSLHEPQHWDLPAARRRLAELVERCGAENVAVEITLDGTPTDAALTEVLQALAGEFRLPLLATGAVRAARPRDAHLADALTALRLGSDLDTLRGHFPPLGRYLRSAEQMRRLHHRAPQAVDAAGELGPELAFDLSLVAPDLPDPDVPEGHTPATWLRTLTQRGLRRRYGSGDLAERAQAVIDHELALIEELDFCGYFLIVREIVAYCEEQGILCQGRGSAANSAVCYVLGITAVDAVRHSMLFERFLSPGRRGYPDIDLDIEACRREEVIQHVYARYGRDYAAQVANVISYRPRSAIRDAARALGYSPGVQDAWSRQVERGHWVRDLSEALGEKHSGRIGERSQLSSPLPSPQISDAEPSAQRIAHAATPRSTREEIPASVRALANRLLELPRHLGVHSGGMVLAAQPVTEVCPVRWAAMEGRSVLQWDKDDCAAAGLVKFDLLGLGMLTALRLAFTSLSERGERLPEHDGEETEWGLYSLPEEDPRVYELLCAADTIGVFQVESRAQMATLPRLRPSTFYDIVVEVALIRPGPIQGKAVNPYIRRRLGREEVTYLHPLLRPALEKTLGVPLFQEQLMQIAVDAAGFRPAEADALRQAMGAKRSVARMEALHARLIKGMRERGIDEPTAEAIFDKLRAFAEFGFPESHAFSFAFLVYASAWLKVHHPEDFYAGILAAQPMGFWSPQTLVADARRHGVGVLAADVNFSQVQASVATRLPGSENEPGWRLRPWNRLSSLRSPEPSLSATIPTVSGMARLDAHENLAVRLGLAPISGLSTATAERIVTEREESGLFRDMVDLARRVRLSRRDLERLAEAGALDSLNISRRRGMWAAGALSQEYGERLSPGTQSSRGKQQGELDAYQPPLPLTAIGAKAPELAEMNEQEAHAADLALTGVSTQTHPLAFIRSQLAERSILSASQLVQRPRGERVRVAGVVTHRQRPFTSAGTVFLNLEDETGLVNVICSPGMWKQYRSIGRRAKALIVRGTVESGDGVTALRAEHLELLPTGMPSARSRDWQ